MALCGCGPSLPTEPEARAREVARRIALAPNGVEAGWWLARLSGEEDSPVARAVMLAAVRDARYQLASVASSMLARGEWLAHEELRAELLRFAMDPGGPFEQREMLANMVLGPAAERFDDLKALSHPLPVPQAWQGLAP